MQLDLDQAQALANTFQQLDRVCPGSPDILAAYSGAMVLCQQYKTAEDILDRAIAIDPSHYEATQRKKYWETWLPSLYYPDCSIQSGTVHTGMGSLHTSGGTVQVVRDGLLPSIAVVHSANKADLYPGITNRVRCKWEPVLSKTPFGTILAHYVMVEDNVAEPYKVEAMLSLFIEDKVDPMAGFWLLDRLSHLDSCFILVVDGSKVLYQSRFVFPAHLKERLKSIVSQARALKQQPDIQSFQRAIAWHQNKYDMAQIRF